MEVAAQGARSRSSSVVPVSDPAMAVAALLKRANAGAVGAGAVDPSHLNVNVNVSLHGEDVLT